MRTVVKVAGSIKSAARANRQKIELAAKQRMAAAVSNTIATTCRCGSAFPGTLCDLSGTACRDMIGQPCRILADSRQERRVHPGQPLQPEEIQARHVGDASAMNRFSRAVDDRQVDPTEITAVAGCPYHRAYPRGPEIEAAQRPRDVRWIRIRCARARLGRHVEALLGNMGIDHIQEARV